MLMNKTISDSDLLCEQSKIVLGHIYHMNHSENSVVALPTESLAYHTLITGSAGTGKSYTVCQMLDTAMNQGVKILVIEPVKGEYKDVFGMNDSVSVYGTNPSISSNLRINPFSFPSGTHILEHLNNLVEVFNVCWPMYSAMPVFLRSAIEKSYVNCGWDLMHSTNRYGKNTYPSFANVTENVKEIIETSECDAECKVDYMGGLFTRLQALTTGINGKIFVADELTPEELFDNNVIVDLSHSISYETSALIMGILLLKLQENRTAELGRADSRLKHITVLEEARVLFERASTEPVPERASCIGQSAEMFSSAMAEMSTYGEGFIVVDQTPSLLGSAVIHNTKTKIILNLPSLDEQVLVGRAANLSDDQIKGLASLPRGVALVCQNEWTEPILCKIEDKGNSYKPENLIQILERVSVLNRDDGNNFTNTDRLDAIASLLSNSAYKRVKAEGLFHLYSAKPIDEINEPVIIVSSHVDCERNITKCFTSFINRNTLLGTYDNAITNAAIIYSMLSGELPENVLIAFTGDEERNSRGAKDVIKFIKRKRLEVLNIFVLDVTEEGWRNGADFTIENDFWDELFGERVIELALQSQYKWNYVPGELDDIPDYVPKEAVVYKEADEDESWQYDEADTPCFSFCLPTRGEMHSDEGILARLTSFESYTDMLQIMLKRLSSSSHRIS